MYLSLRGAKRRSNLIHVEKYNGIATFCYTPLAMTENLPFPNEERARGYTVREVALLFIRSDMK